MKKTILGILVFVGMAAGANTGTVTATLEGGTFNVAFANHAHETNSLWVVYDGFDYGPGTNGWGTSSASARSRLRRIRGRTPRRRAGARR